MLSQLIYVSTRPSDCSDEELMKILEKSTQYNIECEITGVLLFSEDKFLQVLEGDSKKILALYDRIKHDKRHSHVVMISFQAVKERYFPDWAMVSKSLNTNRYRFLTNMDLMAKIKFHSLLNAHEHNVTISIINRLFERKTK